MILLCFLTCLQVGWSLGDGICWTVEGKAHIPAFTCVYTHQTRKWIIPETENGMREGFQTSLFLFWWLPSAKTIKPFAYSIVTTTATTPSTVGQSWDYHRIALLRKSTHRSLRLCNRFVIQLRLVVETWILQSWSRIHTGNTFLLQICIFILFCRWRLHVHNFAPLLLIQYTKTPKFF